VFALEGQQHQGFAYSFECGFTDCAFGCCDFFQPSYLYNSSEFIELLLSQPVKRNKIWFSLFVGLSLSLLFAFFAGAGLPILIYAPSEVSLMMILMGITISTVFVSIAFLSSVFTRDKAKGIGIAIMLWLFFCFIIRRLIAVFVVSIL
jgi:Cu-processing system permease protein